MVEMDAVFIALTVIFYGMCLIYVRLLSKEQK
jgi:hypothetical protein